MNGLERTVYSTNLPLWIVLGVMLLFAAGIASAAPEASFAHLEQEHATAAAGVPPELAGPSLREALVAWTRESGSAEVMNNSESATAMPDALFLPTHAEANLIALPSWSAMQVWVLAGLLAAGLVAIILLVSTFQHKG